MDQANSFESPTTMRLHRAEYLGGLVVGLGFFIAHIGDVRWVPAVLLFAYIDLIGYIPGAIAYRRSGGRPIPKGFYLAYNTMHSLLTQGLVIGLWCWIAKPEWALLVIPIHLCADRGVFGNFLKPFALPFEPVPNEDFSALTKRLFPGAAGVPAPAGSGPVAIRTSR